MSRAQRRAESEERRRQWRLRWIEVGRAASAAGKPVKQAIVEDAARLFREDPTRNSEIEQALREFSANLERAMAKLEISTL